MKRKVSLAVLILLLVSTLAIYIYAQGRGYGTGTGPHMMSADAALCNADGLMIHKSFPSTGTLRIEMKDGTAHSINLSDVKKMTLTDWEHNLGH